MAEKQTIIRIKVEGTSEMEKLKQEIIQAQEAIQKSKKAYKDGALSQKEFVKESTAVEIKLKALKGEFNKQSTTLISLNQEVKRAKGSYAALGEENKKLSAKLRNLADPLGKNKKQFQQLSTQIGKNTDKMKLMDAQMGRFHKNVGNYSSGLGGLRTSMLSVVAVITGAVMAFRTISRVIGSFADFQFAIKQVGAISGATEEELLSLEQQAKDLGGTTSFTANEVAKLQIELAKLGFTAGQIEDMSSGILDLAFIFGNELNEVAKVAGVTLNAFSLEASETTRVVDVLTTAFSNTALDLDKFSTAMPKVGAIASQMGFSIEDTAAMLGLLTSAGFEASTAGTALRNIMLKIADPTSKLAKELGRTVHSLDDLGPALKELEERGIGVTEALGVTDVRAAGAFLTLATGSDELKILQQEMYNAEGATASLAEEMRDSLKGDLDVVSSSATQLGNDLVQSLEPALRAVARGLSFVLQNGVSLLKSLVPLLAAFVTFKTLMIANTIAQVGFTKGLGKTNIMVRAAKALQHLWNNSIKANPIIAFIAALVAVGTAIAVFSNQLTSAEKDQENLNKLKAQAVADTMLQSLELDKYLSIAQDATKSDKERQKAIDALNKEVAGLNGELSLNNVMTDNATEAVNKHKEALLAAAMVTGLQQELAKKSTELWEAQNANVEEFVTGWQKLGKVLSSIGPANWLDMAIDKTVNNRTRHDIMLEAAAKTQEKAIKDLEVYINKLAAAVEENQVISAGINKTTLAMIMAGGAYANTLVEQKQKLADLMKVRDEELEKSDTWNKAQAEVLKQSKKVNEMIENTKEGIDKNVTSYQKLSGAVKDATDILRDYLTDHKEINEETIKAMILNGSLISLTGDLTEAKTEQLRVDKLLKGIIDDITGSLGGESDAYADLIKKLTEKRAKNEEELEMLKKIQAVANDLMLKQTLDIDIGPAKIALEEIEGIERGIAKAIIKSKLEIVQATLQMAEADIIAMGTDGVVTEAMVENIRSLQAQIGLFTEFLNEKSEDGEVQFLQKALWGTGDDDDPTNDFEGQDFVDSVNIVFDAVGSALNSLSTIISNNLSAQTEDLQTEKEKQVDAFLASARAETMSEEEKTDEIAKIETGFNDQMFELELEAFKKQQAFQYAQVGMATAMAIMNIWAQPSASEFFSTTAAKWIMTGLMTAMGIAQAAAIASTPAPTVGLGGIEGETFAEGGMVFGSSHKNGGVKFDVGGRVVELEGGEAVINKKSTSMFKGALSSINQAGGGKKFAQGGITLDSDIMEQGALAEIVERLSTTLQQPPEIVLTEANVSNSQRSVETIETKATF